MGTQNPLVRADMVYFTTRNNGAVFVHRIDRVVVEPALLRLGQQRLAHHAERARRRSPARAPCPAAVHGGGEGMAVDRAGPRSTTSASSSRSATAARRGSRRPGCGCTNPRLRRVQHRVAALRAGHPGDRPARTGSPCRLPGRRRGGGDRGPRRAGSSRWPSAPISDAAFVLSRAPLWSSCSTRIPTRRDGSDAGRRSHSNSVPHAQRRGGLRRHRRRGLQGPSSCRRSAAGPSTSTSTPTRGDCRAARALRPRRRRCCRRTPT